MAGITVHLEGEPVGKGRPRFSRKGGRAYTPAKTRSYENDLAWAAKTAMTGRKPLEGPLAVTVTAFMGIPRSWGGKKQATALAWEIYPASKPDADNVLKIALDALNGIVFQDDKQVIDARIVKVYAAKPALLVEVRGA